MKKTFILLSSFLLVSMMGCVKRPNSSNGSSSSSQNDLSSSSADEYIEEDLDLSVDTTGTTISMWVPFSSDLTDILNTKIQEFSQMTGINVNFESKGSYANLHTAVMLASQSRKYPNLLMDYSYNIAEYVDNDIQMNLDEFIEQDATRPMISTSGGVEYDAQGIRRFDYYDFFEENLIENEHYSLDDSSVGYVGPVGAIPFFRNATVLGYNATFFDWVATQDSIKNKIILPQVKGLKLKTI